MIPFNNASINNMTTSALFSHGLQQALTYQTPQCGNGYGGPHASNSGISGQNNGGQNSQQMLIQMILPLLAQIVSMMQQQGSNGNGNHGNGPGYGDGSNQGNGCGCGNPVGVDNCRVWGDPHFVGADGGKYDVQGEAGKTYNILSDQGLQFNALFESWGSKEGATVMSDAGLTVNGNQLHFDKAGTLTVNGEKLGDGSHFGGGVVKDGDTVKITTGEYQVELKAVDGKYLNYDFKSDNVNADGIMPHGLWGQSADGDGEARNGDKGAGAQGGGAIESLNDRTEAGDTSAVGLYETNELWDTGFSNFNRYW